MDTSEDSQFHLRSFEQLLYDAVHLAYLAEDADADTDDSNQKARFSRNSILSTLLLFECGANCCLEVVTLTQTFRHDADKLPFLSKYELFLSRLNPNANFDRGCREVQAVAELKVVRDHYVHPKVRRAKYFKADDLYTPDFGRTRLLNIAGNPDYWNVANAIAALAAANAFFNLFFLGWCGLDAGGVCEILMSYEKVMLPTSSYTFIDGTDELDRAVRRYGIDFKFIGKSIQTI